MQALNTTSLLSGMQVKGYVEPMQHNFVSFI